MVEEKNVEVTDKVIVTTLERISKLKSARESVASLKNELLEHQKDLSSIETVYGLESKEYVSKKERINFVTEEIKKHENEIVEYSFKKSELKPVLDQVAKNFERELKAEQEREYHIEIAPVGEEDGTGRGNGKKIFKQLLEYLYKNVTFTPKTAANLMVLVRNMEENKPFVNSKEFDNVIILRSANVLNLWRFIVDDLSGKGFYEARTFLECWANCGQSISEAVREIQKEHETTREIGTNLDIIESEFDRSEDDLEHNSQSVSTQEEVAPEVAD